GIPGPALGLGCATRVASSACAGPAVCGDPPAPRLQRLDPLLRSHRCRVGPTVAAPGARATQPGGQPGAAIGDGGGRIVGELASTRPDARLDARLATAGRGAPLSPQCGQYSAPAARRPLRPGRHPGRCRLSRAGPPPPPWPGSAPAGA